MGGFTSSTARTWLVGLGTSALAAAVLTGTSALPAQANGAGYAFTGTVTQQGTGWPVPGATVAAVDEWGGTFCWTQTDGSGVFDVSGCTFSDSAAFRIFVNPPVLGVDDTVDSLGSAVLPSLASTYMYSDWVAADDTNIELEITTANLVGQVKKQADDSSVSGNDVSTSATILDSDGYMTDNWLPIRPTPDGRFRTTIPVGVAPYGLSVMAEPNPDSDPGTLDDTFAPVRVPVTGNSLYNSPPADIELVLPPVNFWGTLLDYDGNPVPGDNQTGAGYVSADIGQWPNAVQVLGRQADSNGIVRLHVDRTLTASESIRFRLDLGDPIGVKYRTYQLADDSGSSASSPMNLQPLEDNLIVSVFAGDDSDVGAYVNINPPGGGSSLLDGETNELGQLSGYVDNPGSLFMVDIQPSNAAQSAGFGPLQQELTPTDPDGDGIFEIRVDLLSDNLTINVRTPGDDPVDGADVFLNTADYQWIGYRQTDGNGQARYGVESEALDGQFQLQIQPQGEWASQGLASFNGLVTPDVNNGSGTIDVTLQLANLRVYVDDSDGDPLSGADIWINPMNSNTGYSGRTDDTGYAYIYMPPNLLDSFMYINVSAPWDQRNIYSDRNYQEVPLTAPVGDGPYTFSATLLEVNSLFTIVKPEAGSPAMPYANLEFREPGDYRTLFWSNANQAGEAGVTLTDGVFDMFVLAPWNSQDDTVYGRTKYTVTVQDEAIVSVVDDDSQSAIQVGNRWIVSPQPATYGATVVKPDSSPVANTWVEILRDVDGWQEYVDGSSTNFNGRFGLNFSEDDTYTVRARPPWGEAGLAPAADCIVVIEQGDLAAGTTCGDTLTLREPNLRLTLVNEADEPQPNSWACVGREFDWNWTCEGSSMTGEVALLVDDTVGDDTVGDLIVEANPPWSSSDLAPARVTIADDSFVGVASVDETVVFASPNVQVQVSLDGDAQAARWSWVSIVKIDGPNWTWLGGGPANADGVVNFSIDDTVGSSFCVGVYPPWEVREAYGPVEECGVSIASGSYNVDLRAANVATSVIDADGRANAWGWAEIKQGNTSLGGSGLDERGRFVAALDPGTYQVTFYPGWKKVGSPKTITVVVDANGDATLPSVVQLGGGNVAGSVELNGQPYGGVIVIATQGSTVVTAVTDAAGDFKMELESGSWTVATVAPDDGASPTLSFDPGVTWNSPTLVVP